MKKLVRIGYLFLVLFTFTHCNKERTIDNIQEINSNDIDTYEQMEIEKNQLVYNNTFSEFISNDNYITVDNPQYKIDKMYFDNNISPVGWSDKGYFAYAQSYISENIHGARYSIIQIMNIITNEIVEMVDCAEPFEEMFYYPYETFDEFLIAKNEEIISLLQKYDIVYGHDIELYNIETLSEKYNLEILLEEGTPIEVQSWINEPPSIKQMNNILIVNIKNERKIIAIVGELYKSSTSIRYSVLDIVGYYEYPYDDIVVLYFKDKKYMPSLITTERIEQLAGFHLVEGYN